MQSLKTLLITLIVTFTLFSCRDRGFVDSVVFLNKLDSGMTKSEIQKLTKPEYLDIDWNKSSPDNFDSTYTLYNTNIIEEKGNFEILYRLRFKNDQFKVIVKKIQKSSKP